MLVHLTYNLNTYTLYHGINDKESFIILLYITQVVVRHYHLP